MTAPKPLTEIASLLRQHGALDDLPDFKTIRVTRATLSPLALFKKDRTGRNRFTLFEALLGFYRISGMTGNLATPHSMPFPDLSRIRIQRFSPTKPAERKEILVNIVNNTNGIDCAKDMQLEFGDLIEIPEREHTLAEGRVGLTTQQTTDLAGCIPKNLRFSVRGESVYFRLASDWSYLSAAIETESAQKLLRSSSDLSRVKVIRKEPATGRLQEFVVDCTPPSVPGGSLGILAFAIADANRPTDDLWLQDGDVIEVPDKQ